MLLELKCGSQLLKTILCTVTPCKVGVDSEYWLIKPYHRGNPI